MANTKSAIKNARKNTRRHARNQRVKTRLKTLAKNVRKVAAEGDAAQARVAAHHPPQFCQPPQGGLCEAGFRQLIFSSRHHERPRFRPAEWGRSLFSTSVGTRASPAKP